MDKPWLPDVLGVARQLAALYELFGKEQELTARLRTQVQVLQYTLEATLAGLSSSLSKRQRLELAEAVRQKLIELSQLHAQTANEQQDADSSLLGETMLSIARGEAK